MLKPNRNLIAIAVAACCAPLAACGSASHHVDSTGGSNSGSVPQAAAGSSASANASPSPAAVVKVYFSALSRGDGPGACSQLTVAMQQHMASQFAAMTGKRASCSDLVALIPAAARSSLTSVNIVRVATSAKQAQVTASANSRTVVLGLTSAGGRWLISTAPSGVSG